MLTYLQAIVFGLLQGVTELFPISSLGHSVILPKLLGWNVNQHDPFFLTFLVATHAATAIVLFCFFWKDWIRIARGLLRSLRDREINMKDTDAKLGWLLIIGTIPAGALGLFLDQPLKDLFALPQLVAFVLVINGALLAAGEFIRRRYRASERTGGDARIAGLSFKQSFGVGLFQSLALVPGFSRTGSTIVGGLFAGLSHEDAARFSFLLATPIIGAAAALKLPELLSQDGNLVLGPTIIGALCAAVAAFLSVKFLTKYFESNKLTPFAIYCTIIGLLATAVFLVR
jgi:undecaprenyl-diphosphatase